MNECVYYSSKLRKIVVLSHRQHLCQLQIQLKCPQYRNYFDLIVLKNETKITNEKKLKILFKGWKNWHLLDLVLTITSGIHQWCHFSAALFIHISPFTYKKLNQFLLILIETNIVNKFSLDNKKIWIQLAHSKLKNIGGNKISWSLNIWKRLLQFRKYLTLLPKQTFRHHW